MLFSLLLIFAGCKKKSAVLKVEKIESVTYIHNPARPSSPEKTVLFEKELTIGEQDERAAIQIHKPSRYGIDGKGNIYISDDSDMSIKVFDRNGRYLKTIGRKGSEPGEFESFGFIVGLSGAGILVMDGRARRTSLFNPEGEYFSSYNWKDYLNTVYLTTDSSYTVNENIFEEGETQLWIKTFDFYGKELVSFGKFTLPKSKSLHKGNVVIGVFIPYSPQSIFAGDEKQQWLYHCLNNDYLIEVYDQTGRLFRKIDRPYKPVPYTSEDEKKFLSRYEQRPDSPATKLAKQIKLPKVKTVAERLVVDDQGNLWVETNEEKKEGEKALRAYDVFNKKGFYEARVWCEFRPGLFSDGKMYRFADDQETGQRTLNCYRVLWKEQ